MDCVILLGEFCENVGPIIEAKLQKQFEKVDILNDDLSNLISKIFSADLTQNSSAIESSKDHLAKETQDNYTVALRFDLEPCFILVYFNLMDIECRGMSRSCVVGFSTKMLRISNNELVLIRDALVKFVLNLINSSKSIFCLEKRTKTAFSQDYEKRTIEKLLGINLIEKLDLLLRSITSSLERNMDSIVSNKFFHDIGPQKFKNAIGWILKTLIYNVLMNKKIIILCNKDFSIPILQNFLLTGVGLRSKEPKTLKFIEKIDDLNNLERNYGAITENKEEFARIKLNYNEEFGFYDAVNSRYYGPIYKKGILDLFDKRTFTLEDIRKILVEIESLTYIKYRLKKCAFIERYSENDREIIHFLSRELFHHQ